MMNMVMVMVVVAYCNDKIMDSIARAPKMNSAGAYGHTSAGN
jgi:hypothetical protein